MPPAHDVPAGLLTTVAGDGRVCLTFDDGPDPVWTPRILDALEVAGARATFFVIGRAAREAGPLLRRMRAQGHEIGNHSYSHRHPWTMSAAVARLEVRNGTLVIAEATGEPPRLFRPPHGRLRRAMAEQARADGQRLVLWSRSAIDWGPFGHARAISKRLDHVATGDIVLLHDGRNRHNRPEEMLRVLPGFLSRLARRGLVPALLTTSDDAY